jgi:hypothetical protein
MVKMKWEDNIEMHVKEVNCGIRDLNNNPV